MGDEWHQAPKQGNLQLGDLGGRRATLTRLYAKGPRRQDAADLSRVVLVISDLQRQVNFRSIDHAAILLWHVLVPLAGGGHDMRRNGRIEIFAWCTGNSSQPAPQ